MCNDILFLIIILQMLFIPLWLNYSSNKESLNNNIPSKSIKEPYFFPYVAEEHSMEELYVSRLNKHSLLLIISAIEEKRNNLTARLTNNVSLTEEEVIVDKWCKIVELERRKDLCSISLKGDN